MKKINTLFYIIGIVCIIIAGYILVGKFFDNSDIEINFNEDEEIGILNDKLVQIGSPLGWIIFVDALDKGDNNDVYCYNHGELDVTFNENLFDNYGYRQLFVMEYILSDKNNYEKFHVESSFDVLYVEPTDTYSYAYLNYDDFNSYYKSFFGENFDTDKSVISPFVSAHGMSSREQVYYDNRRDCFYDMYVSMMQANEVEYNDGIYKGEVIVTYNTKASEIVGSSEDIAIIEYTKDINNNIILKSFSLKER